MAASFLLSPGGPSGTSSGRSLEKNSPRIRAERRTGALKVPVLPHALQPLGALWAYERLLYNVRCPAGCRPGFTYLPSSASVDTVLAGHAHYYGCRASIGWLGARVLPSQAAEHSRVTAPTLEGAGRETDLRVRASRSRATPSV